MSRGRKTKNSVPINQEWLACRRMLAVTEEELCRIILDIHDGPVQKLFVALSEVNRLQRRLEREEGAGQGEVAAALQRVASLLEGSQREIRTFLGAFRPPEFRQRDLLSLFKELIVQQEEYTGNRVDLEVVGEVPTVDVPTKIALYRILQEALSNAHRHAGVDDHYVRLWSDDGSVWMEVSDRGAGFEPPPLTGPAGTEREEHIGLRGMRDRVVMLGGNFELHSRTGQGTRITVQVPRQ